ncbi:hypothetical protein B0H12DRAFT_1235793 [Mycena haematopus]|nr:hypothetical protein B0H12DRAFT_1235793 [Mycena haematopus]
MSLDTLYHSPVHTNGARPEVLADISLRGIKFPDFADLRAPMQSSFSGEFLTTRTSLQASLVELVTDMILVHPVNFDSPSTDTFRLLNFGPGTGLLKMIVRAFPQQLVSSEPIAIVGMAVNLPGAPNAAKLWEVLENGINTILEIPEHRFKVEDHDGEKYPKPDESADQAISWTTSTNLTIAFSKSSPREAKSKDAQQYLASHRSFEASADGCSRSEGCGVFVLKRLRDAIAENDNILGVVRGIESIRAVLRTQSRTLTQPLKPRSSVKSSKLRGLTRAASMSSRRHAGGDPNEVESVRSVLAVNRAANNPLHITSVKANIGHMEAASGAAGLTKLLLMLQHRLIPRQISFKNLHPLMTPLEDDNTIIDKTHAPWLPSHEGMTRTALLNNFGAAGSNTALLLEDISFSPIPSDASFVFGLSAKAILALKELRTQYIHWLRSPSSNSVPLADIASTTTARRQIFHYRLAISASTHEELIETLESAAVVQGPNVLPQAFYSPVKAASTSVWGAGSTTNTHSSAVASTSARPSLRPQGSRACSRLFSGQTRADSLQWRNLKLTKSLSSRLIVGQSLGEYAALVVAGVVTMKEGLLMVASRARLMVQKLRHQFHRHARGQSWRRGNCGFYLPTRNGSGTDSHATMAPPTACCRALSGPPTQLKAFKAHLDNEAQCKCILIPVPFGYHSTAMTALQEDLTATAKRVTLRPPTIPIVSNVLGDVALPGDASVSTAEYFARHCTEPVHFDRGVRALVSRPEFRKVDAWVEIGPHTTCLPMLRANPTLSKATLLLASLRKHHLPFATLAASLEQLYTSNFSLRWRVTFAHLSRVTCVSLPSYSFTKTTSWVQFQETTSAVVPEPVAWMQHPDADDFISIVEMPIGALSDALAGVNLSARHLQMSRHDSHVVLRRAATSSRSRWCTTKPSGVPWSPRSRWLWTKAASRLIISSRLTTTGGESVHVRGEFKYRSPHHHQSQDETHPEVFSTHTAYKVIFPRVVDYTSSYHAIWSLTVDATVEGCATIQLPSDYDRGQFVVHPVWMDTLLHVAGFMANLQGSVNDAYICTQGAVKVFPALVNNDKSCLIYCNNAWLPDGGIILGETYAVQVAEPRRIVAHMKGIHFRRVRLSSLKKSLAHAVGEPVFHSPRPTDQSDVDSMMATEIFAALRAAFPHADLDAHVLSICTTIADICRETWSEQVPCPRTLFDDMALELDLAVSDVVPDMLRILSSALDVSIDSLGAGADLDAIGMDFMAAIEVRYALKAEFGLELPNDFFTSCSTPRAIQASVHPSANLKTPGPLQSGFYSPGPSLSARLGRITAALQLNTPSSSFTMEAVWSTTMIASPSSIVRFGASPQPSFRRCAALGWHGGHGYCVSGICAKRHFGPASAEWMVLRRCRGDPGQGHPHRLPKPHQPHFALRRTNRHCHRARRAKKQFSMNARMLRNEGFHPSGVADIPTWLADRSDPQTSVAAWQSLVHCSVEVLDIPGNHFQPFHSSNTAELSLRITDGCEYLENLRC